MERYVDFSNGDVVKIHKEKILTMPQIAIANKIKRRYRLCLHDSPDNSLQEMFICRTQGDYVPPDKHFGIPESHTIIQGSEAIILFSDDGDIIDVFLLDRDRGYISYRINSDVYHMTVPITDVAIDYEVKPGPFLPENNIYPDWAPKNEDNETVQLFLNQIQSKINDYIDCLGLDLL